MIRRVSLLALLAALSIPLLVAVFLMADEPLKRSLVAVPRQETVADRVADLLARLETGSARERATAHARLRDIGPGVLEVLPALHYGKNAETRRRILDVMDDIRRDHQMPLPDKDLEFAVVTGPVWQLPPRGETRKVKFEVLILGRSQAGRRMFLCDTIGITLFGPDDQSLTGSWNHINTNGRNPMTPPLKRGDLFVCDFFETTLWRNAAGVELRVDGTQGFGGSLFIKGLNPGRYQLVVRAGFNPETVLILADGTRPWCGFAQSLPVPIRIE